MEIMRRRSRGRGRCGMLKVHGLEPFQLLPHRPAVLRHHRRVAALAHFVGQVGHVLLHRLKHMRRELRHRPLFLTYA